MVNEQIKAGKMRVALPIVGVRTEALSRGYGANRKRGS